MVDASSYAPVRSSYVVWFGVSAEHAADTLDNMVSELPERETERATLICPCSNAWMTALQFNGL